MSALYIPKLMIVCKSWKRSIDTFDFKILYEKEYGHPTHTQRSKLLLESASSWRTLYVKRKTVEQNLATPGFQPRVLNCINTSKSSSFSYFSSATIFGSSFYLNSAQRNKGERYWRNDVYKIDLETSKETVYNLQSSTGYFKSNPITEDLIFSWGDAHGVLWNTSTLKGPQMTCPQSYGYLFVDKLSEESNSMMILKGSVIHLVDIKKGGLISIVKMPFPASKVVVDADRIIIMSENSMWMLSKSELEKNMKIERSKAVERRQTKVIQAKFTVQQLQTTTHNRFKNFALVNYNTITCLIYHGEQHDVVMRTVKIEGRAPNYQLVEEIGGNSLLVPSEMTVEQGYTVVRDIIINNDGWRDEDRDADINDNNDSRIKHPECFTILSPSMCLCGAYGTSPLSFIAMLRGPQDRLYPPAITSKDRPLQETLSDDYSKLYHVDHKHLYVLDLMQPQPASMCRHMYAVVRTNDFSTLPWSDCECGKQKPTQVLCLACREIFCRKHFKKHIMKNFDHHLGCQYKDKKGKIK